MDTLRSPTSARAYATPGQRRGKGPVLLAVVGAFILFTVLFSTSAVTEVENAALNMAHRFPDTHKISEKLHNPFSHAVHEPPVQQNSTAEDSKWYSDWKWLNPFSSTITLDDTRSVLPPLQPRPPIYTFYDADAEKEKEVRAAEYELLAVWRRAWWAQGFKPVILGKAEAMKNPHYENLQKLSKELPPAATADAMRWLAWGHMGSGILANWLVLPMGARDDRDLDYLRRADYARDVRPEPKILRYEGLAGALISGSDRAIDAAIAAALEAGDKLAERKSVLDTVADRNRYLFEVDPKPAAIAFYEPSSISSDYPYIADQIQKDSSRGLRLLADLINYHLHSTFLSIFTGGIVILTPRPLETTLLTVPAIQLAHAINSCPKTPIPRTCPPNVDTCVPCASQKIIYSSAIPNATDVFTIGTIPHPYTLAQMIKGGGKGTKLDVAYIRRHTERDPWLETATEKNLPDGISAYQRIIHFKEAIVSGGGQARAAWHSAERPWTWGDLSWRFGFTFAEHGDDEPLAIPEAKSDSYPADLSPLLEALNNYQRKPSRADIVRQHEEYVEACETLARPHERARFRFPGSSKGGADMRTVVEAWHLADTEAWRFVRAWEARARLERLGWEKDEKKFLEEIEGKFNKKKSKSKTKEKEVLDAEKESDVEAARAKEVGKGEKIG